MAITINNLTLNFQIKHKGSVANALLEANIKSFSEAAKYIKELPYNRNVNKHDILCVLKDGYGTCSTKHALLKQLTIEHAIAGVQLMVGVFRMRASYSQKIAGTLERNNLEFIPEAHCYLRIDGAIVDCTNGSSFPRDFEKDLICEIEIQPEQINEFKVNYHKSVLQEWLTNDKNIHYSLDEIFRIREQCIQNLSS